MENDHGFFLVDISNDIKHILNQSECILGRGWLNCEDKRISRNHGILAISPDNCVSITSTHTNPIFYKTKDDETLRLINKEDKRTINVGDSFGLLPDSHWFTIFKRETPGDNEQPGNSDINSPSAKPCNESQNNNVTATPENSGKRKLPSWMTGGSSKKAKAADENQNDALANSSSSSHVDSSDAALNYSNVQNPESEKPPNDADSDSTEQMVPETSIGSSSAVKIKTEPVDNLNASTDSADANPSTSSADSTNAVRNKTEVKQEPDDGNLNDDEEERDAGPSAPDDENAASSTNTTDAQKIRIKKESDLATADSTSGSSQKSRDCCPYGVRCYRRNPIHRLEMAHPGDRDYRRPNYTAPPTGTPPCPFGADCYRRNPVHFQQFSHPPSTNPAQTRKKIRKAKDTSNDGGLMQRLRIINTNFKISYCLDDNDDEEEEDPFKDDGESDEDYQPDTQDYESESESEDDTTPANTE